MIELDDFGTPQTALLRGDPSADSRHGQGLGIDAADPDAYAVLCEQGGLHWLSLRKGLVTGSNIRNVVTTRGEPTKGKVRQGYIDELACVRVCGSEKDHYVSKAMQDGIDQEPHARQWYAEYTGREVIEVGFVYPYGYSRFGCSPDGICMDGGAIEIKTWTPQNYQARVVDGDTDAPVQSAILQLQFNAWVCGFGAGDLIQWCAKGDYHANISTHEVGGMADKFAEHVPAFCAEVDARENELREANDALVKAMRTRYKLEAKGGEG